MGLWQIGTTLLQYMCAHAQNDHADLFVADAFLTFSQKWRRVTTATTFDDNEGEKKRLPIIFPF